MKKAIAKTTSAVLAASMLLAAVPSSAAVTMADSDSYYDNIVYLTPENYTLSDYTVPEHILSYFGKFANYRKLSEEGKKYLSGRVIQDGVSKTPTEYYISADGAHLLEQVTLTCPGYVYVSGTLTNEKPWTTIWNALNEKGFNVSIGQRGLSPDENTQRYIFAVPENEVKAACEYLIAEGWLSSCEIGEYALCFNEKEIPDANTNVSIEDKEKIEELIASVTSGSSDHVLSLVCYEFLYDIKCEKNEKGHWVESDVTNSYTEDVIDVISADDPLDADLSALENVYDTWEGVERYGSHTVTYYFVIDKDKENIGEQKFIDYQKKVREENGLPAEGYDPAAFCGRETLDMYRLYPKAIIPNIDAYDMLNGDANTDGELGIADATCILQSIGNPDKYGLSPQGEYNADVDGIYGITANDALEVQNICFAAK